MFRKNILVLLLGVAACLSCNKDVFDEANYNALVEIAQPVSNVDASHTWDLSYEYHVTVNYGTAMPEATRLKVLSGNPANDDGADVLGDYLVSGSGSMDVSFSAPAILNRFYAALVDDEGYYTIASFAAGAPTVSFTNPVATRVKVESHLVGLQSYSYCFEDEMPQPGDYDYNDVVLRISQERTAVNQMTINVTLVAVGSLSQVAAALRLVGYQYDDIESVTTVDNQNFDEGYKKSVLPFIDSSDLLMRGLNGEAVINLFEDAHWATQMVYYASEGYIPRYKYNVSKTTSEEHDMMSPRTVSYIVTFKDSSRLDAFTLGSLDPFIIIEYNGIFMENHAQYKYRLATVLRDYQQPSSAKVLPWALIVPSSSFRYPLDGVSIGYAKDGALFGAYMTGQHAFGEWASNHDTATDWYNYPTGNMVF